MLVYIAYTKPNQEDTMKYGTTREQNYTLHERTHPSPGGVTPPADLLRGTCSVLLPGVGVNDIPNLCSSDVSECARGTRGASEDGRGLLLCGTLWLLLAVECPEGGRGLLL